jgi:hypothetical protein
MTILYAVYQPRRKSRRKNRWSMPSRPVFCIPVTTPILQPLMVADGLRKCEVFETLNDSVRNCSELFLAATSGSYPAEARIRRPRPGVEPRYQNRRSDDRLFPIEDYALIWRVPGLHGKGYTTVFASHTTFGSQAAVEFCVSPQYILELTEQLSGGAGNIPEFCEVVVRAELEKGHPVRVSYVTPPREQTRSVRGEEHAPSS